MVLGHTTTEMLFRIYSRFVPNLTRQDGRAFAGLINRHSADPTPAPTTAQDVDSMDTESLRRALKAQLSQNVPEALSSQH
jgi:integrase